MTGYGRTTAESEQWRVTTELKSVNNRYLDLTIKMPKAYNPLEDRLKKEISSVLSRGHVDLYVSVEEIGETNAAIACDLGLAKEYCRALRQIAEATDVSYQVKLTDIASYNGVLTV